MKLKFVLFLYISFYSVVLQGQHFRIDPRYQKHHQFQLQAITEKENFIYIFYSGTPRSGLICFRADSVFLNQWKGSGLEPVPYIVHHNTPKQKSTTQFYHYQHYLIAHNGDDFYVFNVTDKAKPILYRKLTQKDSRVLPSHRCFWDKNYGKIYDMETKRYIDIASSIENNKIFKKKMIIHSYEAYHCLHKIGNLFLFEKSYSPSIQLFEAKENKDTIHFHLKYTLDLKDYLTSGARIAGYLQTNSYVYILLRKMTWGALLLYKKEDFHQKNSSLQPHKFFKFSLESERYRFHLKKLTEEKLLIYNTSRRGIILKPFGENPDTIVERFYLEDYVQHCIINASGNYIFFLADNFLNIAKKNYNELIIR